MQFYSKVYVSKELKADIQKQFSSVQLLSCVWLFATPWIAARQASLSITNSRGLLKLMSIESVMPSSHLILCHPLLLLPPISPSIWVFSNESTLRMRWPKYWSFSFSISSVQFSRSVVSDSLRHHESQHARPPSPSPTPGAYPDSRPSSQWCHPAISSSVPFSSCPQSLPASESFPMSQLFTWGGQSTGVSALASFLPKKPQGWSPSEWTGRICCSPRDFQESSPTPQFKSINSSALSFLHSPTLTSIHDHRKIHSLD